VLELELNEFQEVGKRSIEDVGKYAGSVTQRLTSAQDLTDVSQGQTLFLSE